MSTGCNLLTVNPEPGTDQFRLYKQWKSKSFTAEFAQNPEKAYLKLCGCRFFLQRRKITTITVKLRQHSVQSGSQIRLITLQCQGAADGWDEKKYVVGRR